MAAAGRSGAERTAPGASAAERRGAEDGARNEPPPHAEGASAFERDIADAHAAQHNGFAARRAAAATEALRALRAESHAPDLAGVAAEAKLTLRQIEARFAPEAAPARERAARARADLEGFRRAHGLRRGAVYPTSTLLQSAQLALAALFEAAFSATLFAEEAEQGLLGGAAIAVGLSGANVTLGFLGGFLGLRYLQHVSLAARLAGGAALATSFALGLALNWFAAQWRQAALGAEQDLYAPGRFDLLGLTEPQSVILLMLGGGVWVFAALKGYSGFDDPYPDYGKMDRAARDADEAVAAVREETREALEEAVAPARAALNATLDALRAAARERSALYDAAADAIATVDAEARQADRHAAAAVQAYRAANRAARSTPAPPGFDRPLLASPSEGDPLDAVAAALEAAQQRDAAAQAQAVAQLEALAADVEAIAARLAGA